MVESRYVPPLSKRAAGKPDPYSYASCDIPIAEERKRCPQVRLLRYWVSDDGGKAACRLHVCGEIHTWVMRDGAWRFVPGQT